MYEVKINKDVLVNHMNYDWWKYVVFIAGALFVWNFVFTVTSPKTPPEKKVDVYLTCDYAYERELTDVSNEALPHFPQLEEINLFNVPYAEDGSDIYGWQKVVVLLGARIGDVFVFPADTFMNFAEQSAFISLDEYIEEGALTVGESIESRLIKAVSMDDPEERIYGIPIDDLRIFDESGYDTTGKVIGVTAYSENKHNTVAFINWLLSRMED